MLSSPLLGGWAALVVYGDDLQGLLMGFVDGVC
jgi:hypothetical protein